MMNSENVFNANLLENPDNIDIFSHYIKREVLIKTLSEEYNSSIKERHVCNLFVDVNGVIGKLYKDNDMFVMYNTMKLGNKFIVFDKFMEYFNTLFSYVENTPIKLNIIPFWEKGVSALHKIESNGDYKANRKQRELKTLDQNQYAEYKSLLNENYDMLYKVGNQIPRMYPVRLVDLEADFVPHYLIGYYKKRPDLFNDKNTINIIVTNDKDMYQTLKYPHTFQHIRTYRNKQKVERILSEDNYEETFFYKIRNRNGSLKPGLFPLYLSINGDASDGIEGIKGFGLVHTYKTIIKLQETSKTIKDINDIIDNLILNIKRSKDEYGVLVENEEVKDDMFFSLIDVLNSKNRFSDNEIYDKLIKNIKLSSFDFISKALVETSKNKDWLKNMYTPVEANKLIDTFIDALNVFDFVFNSKRKRTVTSNQELNKVYNVLGLNSKIYGSLFVKNKDM